jgi:hypothetical protein
MANIYVSQTSESAGSHHLMDCSGRSTPSARMSQVRTVAQEKMTSRFVDGRRPVRKAGVGVPWILLKEMAKDPVVSECKKALEFVTLRLREEAEKLSGFEAYRGIPHKAMVHLCKLRLKCKHLPELAELGLSQVQYIQSCHVC